MARLTSSRFTVSAMAHFTRKYARESTRAGRGFPADDIIENDGLSLPGGPRAQAKSRPAARVVRFEDRPQHFVQLVGADFAFNVREASSNPFLRSSPTIHDTHDAGGTHASDFFAATFDGLTRLPSYRARVPRALSRHG